LAKTEFSARIEISPKIEILCKVEIQTSAKLEIMAKIETLTKTKKSSITFLVQFWSEVRNFDPVQLSRPILEHSEIFCKNNKSDLRWKPF